MAMCVCEEKEEEEKNIYVVLKIDLFVQVEK